MSTRQIIYLLAAIIGVAAISAIVNQQSSDRYRTETASTYSTHPKGCKALYLMLEGLGLPVERFRKPFQRLGSTEGALIVIDPHTVPFERGEIDKLEEWVKKGNRLVIFQGASISGSVKPREKDPTNSATDEKKTAGRRMSLADRFGLRLKKGKTGERTICKVSTPRLAQVEELSASGTARWAKPPEEWETLVSDHSGPLIVAKRMGKGEIVAIADPTLVENRFLTEGQNARLLVALLAREEPRPKILFDEYHHGYALAESFWTYTAGSVFAWILFQSVLGLILIIYSRRAVQAGRFKSLASPKGRSSVEYVDSMANFFASRKAGSMALEMILKRFLAQLSRRTGMPLKIARSGSGDEKLMNVLGQSEAAEVVRECNRAIAAGDDPGSALENARELQGVYRKILGTKRPHGKVS